MNAAALVVGIDNYDHAPRLAGAAKDVEDVVAWLAAIGVPADRIRIHVDPVGAFDPKIVRAPTRAEISRSIFELSQESGDRLFVFLSGHGLYIPGEGAVFLTREWGDPFPLDANFGVDAYVAYFRSFAFRDQIVVVDACQNLSNPATQRARIPPNGPGTAGFTPLATSGLTLCQATSQGQFAYVVNGRGLLTPHLLDALQGAAAGRLPKTAIDAVLYDWLTGERKLDLRPLFEVVRGDVRDAAAAQGPQVPTISYFGRASADDYTVVHELDPGSPETVTIDVVSGGLDEVRLALRPPVKELTLPIPKTAPPFPVQIKAPRDVRLRVTCTADLGWEVAPPHFDEPTPAGGAQYRFVLSQPPSGASGPGAGQSAVAEAFNVRILDAAGQAVPVLDKKDYDEIAELPGLGLPAGVHLDDHETGPDISFVAGEETAAAQLARNWRDLLNERVLEGRGQAFIVPPGRDPARHGPNLRITLSGPDLQTLAGFLASETVVRLERVGAAAPEVKEVPLDQIAQRPLVRVEPGFWRASVTLPWGRWATVQEVGEKIVPLEIPSEVGTPPLRNKVRPESFGRYSLNLVGDVPAKFISEELIGGADLQLWSIDGRSFQVPMPHNFIELIGEYRNGELRLEPFSTIPWPEWDTLIGLGQLDAVDLRRPLARLSDLEGLDGEGLLRTALAYSAYAQSDRAALRRLLSSLRKKAWLALPDVVLLGYALDGRAAESGPRLPYFRWGFAIRERLGLETPRLSISGGSIWTVLHAEARPAEEAPAWRPMEI